MSAIIALGPSDEVEIIEEKIKEETGEKYFFQDEVVIDGQKILQIPLEHQFYEQEKTKRKSRWGDRGIKKSNQLRKNFNQFKRRYFVYNLDIKIHQDEKFDPLKALTEQSERLAIECGERIVHPELQKYEKPKNSIVTIQQKITKWGPEYEKTFHPPPIHFIPKNIANSELEYILRLYRLDEVSKKIVVNDSIQLDPDLRSLSPPPQYDAKTGQRVNTRAARGMERLQREQGDLIEECSQLKKTFCPPADYKPPKKQKKFFIPSDDPDMNYIGLILGPKGSTQRMVETKCHCKISIRGRGANKSTRGIDSDEALHILLQAETDEQMEKASVMINKILNQDEDHMNDLKKNNQLQLQAITGVLKDEYCENCMEKGHRIWACPLKISSTVARGVVKCDLCGERSHVTMDCPQKRAHETTQKLKALTTEKDANMSNDFARFIAELEGENAKKLLDFAGKNADNKPVTTVKKAMDLSQRMAFLTDYDPSKLAITNTAGQIGAPATKVGSRFNSNGGVGTSQLTLAKNLNTQLDEKQKNLIFNQEFAKDKDLFEKKYNLNTTTQSQFDKYNIRLSSSLLSTDKHVKSNEPTGEIYSSIVPQSESQFKPQQNQQNYAQNFQNSNPIQAQNNPLLQMLQGGQQQYMSMMPPPMMGGYPIQPPMYGGPPMPMINPLSMFLPQESPAVTLPVFQYAKVQKQGQVNASLDRSFK